MAARDDTDDGTDERWAPIRNPDLLGHAAAEATLARAWASGRLAHAWLIAGPRGIGKATLAYRFARHVIVRSEGGGQGDGQGGGPGGGLGLFGDEDAAPPAESLAVDPDAPAARRIAAGSHPDLRVVQRSRNDQGRLREEIVVGDVRELSHFLRLTPSAGGWRVAVVDAADDLNRNAANALLKILEEPPNRALILLVSHAPGRLLATIRSRCRRLDLQPLPPETVGAAIGRFRPDLPDDERAALVRLSDGSVGRALDLADAGGLALYRDLLALMAGGGRLDLGQVLALADRLSRPGAGDAFRVATELLQWWTARVVAALARGARPEPIVPEEEAAIARIAAAPGLDRWVALWEKNGDLFARAEGLDLDRKQVLLTAILALDRPAA